MKNLERVFIDWVFVPSYVAFRFCILLTVWPLLAWQEEKKGEEQKEYLDHFVMFGSVIIVFGIAISLAEPTLIGFPSLLYLVVGIIVNNGYKKEFGRSFLQ